MEYTSENDQILHDISEDLLKLVDDMIKNRLKSASLCKSLNLQSSKLTQLGTSIQKQNDVINERSNVANNQNLSLDEINMKLYEYGILLDQQKIEIFNQYFFQSQKKRVMKWLGESVTSLNKKGNIHEKSSSINDSLIKMKNKKSYSISNKQVFINDKESELLVDTLAYLAAEFITTLRDIHNDTNGPPLSES